MNWAHRLYFPSLSSGRRFQALRIDVGRRDDDHHDGRAVCDRISSYVATQTCNIRGLSLRRTHIAVCVVGALIFVLGIDLVTEAIWDTRNRVNRMEYITVWAIAIGMTV